MAENQNNAVQHGLNAARSNADNSEQQEQVEQLSSLLQSNAGDAAATSSTLNDEESE